MSDNNTALDNVLDTAAAAAAAHTPASAPDTNLTLVADTGTAVAPAAAAPSMDSFRQNAGIMVDEYLYPDKAGLKISKDMKGYLDDFTVIIDMSEVVPISSFSAEINGASTFLKSYNGVTTVNGQNYQMEQQRLSRQPGAKCRGPFDTVEIPLVLAEDVKDPKSNLTFDEGTEIGLTPSPTGTKEFQRFLKALAKQDPALAEDGVLKVKVIGKPRKNSNGNEWGVAAFELIEVVES